MTTTEWAENEVKIACERERGDKPEDEWDYGCACYESALKAYKSLMEDEHSGMSFSFTVGILKRLLDGKPLTPIENKPEEWEEIKLSDEWKKSQRVIAEYHCKRKSSLFKTVYCNGKVDISDSDRIICKDINTGTTYHFGLIARVANEIYPIQFPYVGEQLIANCEDFLTDEKNGDFDTVGFFTLEIAEKEVEVMRFFKADGDEPFVEISEEEYKERKARKIVR